MKKYCQYAAGLILLGLYCAGSASESCQGSGPQSPRDIDNLAGENKSVFSLAPSYTEMNLCNIHFHKNAEHKAKDFSIFAGHDKHGGYRCNEPVPTDSQSADKVACENVKVGDTIEAHWVYSSCDVEPAPDLNKACASAACTNPGLRAETQVFLVVDDSSGLDFTGFDYGGQVNGYHQAKSLPHESGAPVRYLGSTTGPTYHNDKCSTLQVTFSVRPHCARVNIDSLAKWCEGNKFDEHEADGARPLVTNPKLLSEIK